MIFKNVRLKATCNFLLEHADMYQKSFMKILFYFMLCRIDV
ncbi:hypothetical protein THOM_1970 [Trachipleistophora hominis]|uniref:Uncharacterized protein n=1 Tax=Trachipleistophora hominis TaxID=72359 RepID=L7JUD4_TRAHO|nr:hypothetical protein THOM_1970 [Trachipleistophora hominis]